MLCDPTGWKRSERVQTAPTFLPVFGPGIQMEAQRFCLCFRLGAVHRALAQRPVMAESGCWSTPPSTPEDRRSSKAEAGRQHHLGSAG